ncbi:MAG: carbon-nitrogen hydrolase family protein [Pirellulales bacterium]|nr:carbon-nitrogen hydrolase family protein [Pirellulales bacterium]
MTAPFKIAAAQIDIQIGDAPVNINRMEEVLRETSWQQADITIFPEAALCGYCFESLEEALQYAEPINGPSLQRLSDICAELKSHCIFGMLETEGSALFNTCVLLGPEGLIGRYRKVHLPTLGVDRFVTAGDELSVFQVGDLRVGLNVCYDSAFPEAARILALSGADLIVLPTNWPPGAFCNAEYVINARALENSVYYAAVNRVGEERGFNFIGKSRICDPEGNTLATADHDQEAILYATIDPELARNKRKVRVPAKHEIDRFNDRRPDVYAAYSDGSA